MPELTEASIVTNKFVEVPESLNIRDKEMLLHLQLKALQQEGYTILATHIYDKGTFRVEVRPNQMFNGEEVL